MSPWKGWKYVCRPRSPAHAVGTAARVTGFCVIFHPPTYPPPPLREQCPSATFGTMSSFALCQYAPVLEQRCGLRTLVLLLQKGEVALKGWRHKSPSPLSPADLRTVQLSKSVGKPFTVCRHPICVLCLHHFHMARWLMLPLV